MFHSGSELNLKTRVLKGEAWIDEHGLNITGPMGSLLIERQDIQKAELTRLHGLGRIIRIEHRQGPMFLSVVRLMIGQFAIVNFLRTGELHRQLASLATA